MVEIKNFHQKFREALNKSSRLKCHREIFLHDEGHEARFLIWKPTNMKDFGEKIAHLSIQEAVKNSHDKALRRRIKGWT